MKNITQLRIIWKDAFEDVQQYKKLCNFLFIKDSSKCIKLVTIPLQVFADGATWYLSRWHNNFGTIISKIKKIFFSTCFVLFRNYLYRFVITVYNCVFHPTFLKQLNIDISTHKGHLLAVIFLHDTYYFLVHSCFLFSSPHSPFQKYFWITKPHELKQISSTKWAKRLPEFSF